MVAIYDDLNHFLFYIDRKEKCFWKNKYLNGNIFSQIVGKIKFRKRDQLSEWANWTIHGSLSPYIIFDKICSGSEGKFPFYNFFFLFSMMVMAITIVTRQWHHWCKSFIYFAFVLLKFNDYPQHNLTGQIYFALKLIYCQHSILQTVLHRFVFDTPPITFQTHGGRPCMDCHQALMALQNGASHISVSLYCHHLTTVSCYD